MERVLFDNYDFEAYDNEAREQLADMDYEDPTQEQVYEMTSELEQNDWDDADYEMRNFIEKGKSFIAIGTCGRWDGTYEGGLIFGHWDDFKRRVFADCEYFKIWDEKGHLYVKCSHHDGTNFLEIKELTDRGFQRYENWQYDYSVRNDISERELHKRIFKDSHYAKLPHFADKVWGKVA